MDMRSIVTIVLQEFIINGRNRWTVIFAVVFGVLVVSVSYAGIMAEGFTGMQNFTRTSASLLNLVLHIVPLVALTMGTLSFTGDKGSTELLFSQPVARGARSVFFGGGLIWRTHRNCHFQGVQISGFSRGIISSKLTAGRLHLRCRSRSRTTGQARTRGEVLF